MVVGVLRAELHVPEARSLKDKRSVIKSLKDRMHGRFNVAVAEVDANDMWQRACLGVAAVGKDRAHVGGVLDEVTRWLRTHPECAVIRIDEECY